MWRRHISSKRGELKPSLDEEHWRTAAVTHRQTQRETQTHKHTQTTHKFTVTSVIRADANAAKTQTKLCVRLTSGLFLRSNNLQAADFDPAVQSCTRLHAGRDDATARPSLQPRSGQRSAQHTLCAGAATTSAPSPGTLTTSSSERWAGWWRSPPRATKRTL